jgi:hydroxymethylpyrimidine pyrophosphatase-like HAD family hydrolase
VRFRLVALDVDGTILGERGEVSGRVVAALAAVAGAGATVTLATGRPPVALGSVVPQLGGHVRYSVCGNGVSVHAVEPDSWPLLHRAAYPRATAEALVAGVRAALPAARFAMTTEVGFAFEPGFDALVPDPPPPAGRRADVLELGGELVTGMYVFEPGRDVHALTAAVAALVPDGLDAVYAGLPLVDVVVAGTDKATGVAWLCDHLGLDAADVVAFGDNVNDHAMLRWAGHGVAMGNADAATRAVADEVAPAIDDDGVAVVLERLLEEER